MARIKYPRVRAEAARAAVAAALSPGGKLYSELWNLIDGAGQVALDAAGVPLGEGTPAQGWDDRLVDQHMAAELADAYFGVALLFCDDELSRIAAANRPARPRKATVPA